MSKPIEPQILSGCVVRAEIQREQVTQLCEHYTCRCARARELADMADITGNWRYLREAVEVHEQLVRCRMST